MNDLTGQKFSRLTVISREGSTKFGVSTWNCICDCGNHTVGIASNLKKGDKKSCGCLNKETRIINAISMGKKNTQNIKSRFFKYVNKLKTGKKCWEWIGDIGAGGYGRIWYKGKTKKAHRVSYLKHKGKIPKGVLVCHTCDNTKCVNPGHLFLGTNKINTADMIKKGRDNFAGKGPIINK